MKETVESILGSIRGRLSNAFIGTYTLFWCALHWQGIITLIFTDEKFILEKYGLLKNEYLDKNFFGYYPQAYYIDLDFILTHSFALFLTYIFIWYLPDWVFIPAYKEDRKYRTKKDIIIYQNQLEIDEYKRKKAIAKDNLLDIKKDIAEKETKLNKINPNLLWEEEYTNISNEKNFVLAMEAVKKIIYSYDGYINKYKNMEHVDDDSFSNDISLADTHGWIRIEKNGYVELTDKGRYILRQYLSSNITSV